MMQCNIEIALGGGEREKRTGIKGKFVKIVILCLALNFCMPMLLYCIRIRISLRNKKDGLIGCITEESQNITCNREMWANERAFGDSKQKFEIEGYSLHLFPAHWWERWRSSPLYETTIRLDISYNYTPG